ncbi:MAG: deoxyribodipyrimidine photo-lyase [Kiritimatiellia bacterium]
MENNRLWIYRAGPPLPGKRYVLYWMQQAQRTRDNLALDWARAAAHACQLPLLVAFALTPNYPGANARHYQFMLEGLADVEKELLDSSIAFVMRLGNPPDVITELARDAALLVGDIGYLRIQRAWRKQIAQNIECPFSAIETDVVVPIKLVSDKEEYAARTIRPKIHRLWDRFLEVPPPSKPHATQPLQHVPKSDFALPTSVHELAVDQRVAPAPGFKGGQQAANRQLAAFIRQGLSMYHTERNDPANNLCSNMSPYLHFGQISPLDIARQIRASGTPAEAIASYLEELIIRRELSMNFVYFNTGYDQYQTAIPEWARKTLAKHACDKRATVYTRAQMETAQTHDPYWNAAQTEMVQQGKMHNYMRMYWGKKVIEWTRSPEEAFSILIEMNDRYEIDGRDPNGYTGIAWCFGKHDRPWTERDIFGTVRYMAASGLERKFKIQHYVDRISGPDSQRLL